MKYDGLIDSSLLVLHESLRMNVRPTLVKLCEILSGIVMTQKPKVSTTRIYDTSIQYKGLYITPVIFISDRFRVFSVYDFTIVRNGDIILIPILSRYNDGRYNIDALDKVDMKKLLIPIYSFFQKEIDSIKHQVISNWKEVHKNADYHIENYKKDRLIKQKADASRLIHRFFCDNDKLIDIDHKLIYQIVTMDADCLDKVHNLIHEHKRKIKLSSLDEDEIKSAQDMARIKKVMDS